MRILNDEEHVAVLFYEEKKRDSMKALQHLELIDDEADLFSIRSDSPHLTQSHTI